MTYLKTITYLLITTILLNACEKDTNKTSNNSPVEDPIIGNYTGIISVQINGTLDAGGAYNASNSETKTVEITKLNQKYFLNGDSLSGGPTVYSLSKNGEDFLISSTNKSIQYASTWKGFGNYGGGKGNYTINKSGVLLKN